MLRHFLFSALAAVALLATTEAAVAQAAPTQKDVRVAYRKAAKAERVLSKREKAAALAAARAEQARRDAQAATAAATTTGNGWGEPLPAPAPLANNRAVVYNSQSAPGMPLNQLGHGVTTDYDGRPIRPAASTTIGR